MLAWVIALFFSKFVLLTDRGPKRLRCDATESAWVFVATVFNILLRSLIINERSRRSLKDSLESTAPRAGSPPACYSDALECAAREMSPEERARRRLVRGVYFIDVLNWLRLRVHIF